MTRMAVSKPTDKSRLHVSHRYFVTKLQVGKIEMSAWNQSPTFAWHSTVSISLVQGLCDSRYVTNSGKTFLDLPSSSTAPGRHTEMCDRTLVMKLKSSACLAPESAKLEESAKAIQPRAWPHQASNERPANSELIQIQWNLEWSAICFFLWSNSMLRNECVPMLCILTLRDYPFPSAGADPSPNEMPRSFHLRGPQRSAFGFRNSTHWAEQSGEMTKNLNPDMHSLVSGSQQRDLTLQLGHNAKVFWRHARTLCKVDSILLALSLSFYICHQFKQPNIQP